MKMQRLRTPPAKTLHLNLLVSTLVIVGTATAGGYMVLELSPLAVAQEPEAPDAGVPEPAAPAVPEEPPTECQQHCRIMEQVFVHEGQYGCICRDYRDRPISYPAVSK